MSENNPEVEADQQLQKKMVQEGQQLIERMRAEKAKKHKGIAVVLDKYSSNQ